MCRLLHREHYDSRTSNFKGCSSLTLRRARRSASLTLLVQRWVEVIAESNQGTSQQVHEGQGCEWCIATEDIPGWNNHQVMRKDLCAKTYARDILRSYQEMNHKKTSRSGKKGAHPVWSRTFRMVFGNPSETLSWRGKMDHRYPSTWGRKIGRSKLREKWEECDEIYKQLENFPKSYFTLPSHPDRDLRSTEQWIITNCNTFPQSLDWKQLGFVHWMNSTISANELKWLRLLDYDHSPRLFEPFLFENGC